MKSQSTPRLFLDRATSHGLYWTAPRPYLIGEEKHRRCAGADTSSAAKTKMQLGAPTVVVSGRYSPDRSQRLKKIGGSLDSGTG